MYSSQNKVVAFTHNNLLGCRLCLTYAQYHLTFYWIPHKLLPNIVVLQRKVNWSLDYNKKKLKRKRRNWGKLLWGSREAKVGRALREKDKAHSEPDVMSISPTHWSSATGQVGSDHSCLCVKHSPVPIIKCEWYREGERDGGRRRAHGRGFLSRNKAWVACVSQNTKGHFHWLNGRLGEVKMVWIEV